MDFKTVVYVTDQDGGDHKVEIRVHYDATYQSERISGPPEDCCPAEGEMNITEKQIINENPVGITDEMVFKAAEDQEDFLEREAWDHFFEGEE